jgi:hypothetical protein
LGLGLVRVRVRIRVRGRVEGRVWVPLTVKIVEG